MAPPSGGLRPILLVAGALAGAATVLALLRRLDVVEVHGSSMHPTLRAGDRLLVESLSYASRSPRRGEIVLAADPRVGSHELVKRVAAVRDGQVELRGDAPDASTDSRTFGRLPVEDIRWRVAGRFWPPRR